MQVRAAGFLAMATAIALLSGGSSALACHKCQKTPCVLVAAPAVQCVTEMVPQTVYRTRTRMESRPVVETVMARVAETHYVERPRTICKPVFETSSVQRTVITCRPVTETTMVSQVVNVCRPVQSTQQVTEYVYQPTTQMVTVPARVPTCGKCGKMSYACGCITVAQTCYTPVATVRDVVVTQMVSEQQTQQVPVTTVRMVQEAAGRERPGPDLPDGHRDRRRPGCPSPPSTASRSRSRGWCPSRSARPWPRPAIARSSGWSPSSRSMLPRSPRPRRPSPRPARRRPRRPRAEAVAFRPIPPP